VATVRVSVSISFLSHHTLLLSGSDSNGDRDMACNAAGTEQLLNTMEWSGAAEWYTTARGLWTTSTDDNSNSNEPAGYAKSHRNLNFGESFLSFATSTLFVQS